ALVLSYGHCGNGDGVESGGRRIIKKLPRPVEDVDRAYFHREVFGDGLDNTLHAARQVGGVRNDGTHLFEQAQAVATAGRLQHAGEFFICFCHMEDQVSLRDVYNSPRPPTTRQDPTHGEMGERIGPDSKTTDLQTTDVEGSRLSDSQASGVVVSRRGNAMLA